MHRLWWIRSDLRIVDNPALREACSCLDEQTEVHALYIVSQQQWQLHDMAPVQIAYIEQNLNVLKKQLAQLGIQLHIRQANSYSAAVEELVSFCETFSIDSVYGNSEPEINEIERDNLADSRLAALDKSFYRHLGYGHFESKAIRTQKDQVFKVFTPFRKAFLQLLEQDPDSLTPFPAPEPLATSSVSDESPIHFEWLSDYCQAFTHCRHNADVARTLASDWPVGEEAASVRLHEFAQNGLLHYGEKRDLPALEATSRLSPVLAFGLLSFRQCVVVAQQSNPRVLQGKEQPGFTWISELIWREFYRYLLVELPDLCKGKNFNRKADAVAWRNNREEFTKWCNGETGYPIVDAAMKQLVQTGWMHNRLRMVVASFLTKHLLIDWRWGEQFFRQHLIDGDLAANNGGWQWAASTGCDGQPYFRVFNPITQSERFDPETTFLCKYLPQLEKVNPKKRHFPQGIGYLAPIVDHKTARANAIAAFEKVMKTG